MPAYQTFVTQLLQIYHGGKPAGAGLIDLPTIDQVKFLCDVGLGPIAFKVYGDEFRQSDPTLFSVLQSSDLTTRVIYGLLEKAAVELAGELQKVGVIPTFLKGISTSEEFYAPHYLRLMGDIDILIKRSEVDLVMAKVADLGYEITGEQWRMYRKHGAHHLPEARHPKTGVSIEVHTGLFAPAEFYSGEYVFQPDIVAEQIIEFDYRGVRVARFTPEFQFIYTVSKWSVDRDWSVNLKNINDTIHILRKYESEFDWPTLSRWLAASPHLFPIIVVLLHYLEQADIITVSPQLFEALAGADRKLGSKKLRLLAWLLHTFPFNARNKVYDGYARWFAHALWLYLTKPNDRDLGIPSELFHQFYMSALYGKYTPIPRVRAGLKALVYRIRKD
jgi:hypothetical protein